MTNASHLTFSGFVFEVAQEDGVVLTDCNNITFLGCTFRNLGKSGVKILGGHDVRVIGCDITETGRGGIDMNGGDRQTLRPANHAAINNHIWRVARWRRMYSPGIHLSGVEATQIQRSSTHRDRTDIKVCCC